MADILRDFTSAFLLASRLAEEMTEDMLRGDASRCASSTGPSRCASSTDPSRGR